MLRGEVAEAQELADRLIADGGDADTLAAASALRAHGQAARSGASRWPSGPRSWALAAGRRGAAAGRGGAGEGGQAGAVAAYLGVAKRDPSFFEARLRAAEILREQGKLDEAERALDGATRRGVAGGHAGAGGQTGASTLAIARSQVDEKRGDAARAARRLDEALGKGGDAHGDPRLLLARAGGRRSARATGSARIARGERLLARKPRNVEALNFVGFVAADHGHDLPRAIRRLQAAVALSPGSGAIIDSLGWAYFRAGDLARADVFLEQAGRLEPGDPEMLEHLGDLYAEAPGARPRAGDLPARAAASSRPIGSRASCGDRIRTLEAKSAAGR